MKSMADDDIYKSKRKYETFVEHLESFAIRPEEKKTRGKAKYYCKNSKNLQYFQKLFLTFDARDTSYARRCRLINTCKLICYATEKDIADCDRDDINAIIAYMHGVYNTPKSKSDFLRDLKYVWKTLFPDLDEKGRPDETIMPYVVRHVSARIDKSKEKLRDDRMTGEEFERILAYFSTDPRIQAYLFLALESLGRPQELLYTKIKDIELYDQYAKIWISEHGKEGTGFLQCIDSFPYVSTWYNHHPLKHDKNAYFFINLRGTKEKYQQLRPSNLNKIFHTACRELDIHKPITCYSLKRNGVTFRRLRGDSDAQIQHAAREQQQHAQHAQEERKQRKKTERVSFRLNRAWLSKIEGFAQQREDTVSRSLLVLIKAGFDHIEQGEKSAVGHMQEQAAERCVAEEETI